LCMERSSILEYLDNLVRRGSECAYLRRRGYRTVHWTYGEIAQFANRLANELTNREIGEGDRVLLWGPNSAEWVIAFLGCALRGAVVVPMDNVATPDFAMRVHKQVDAKLLVCSHEHIQPSVASLILEDLPQLLTEHPAPSSVKAKLQRDDPLEIVFTSGTTAEPKGVVITHGNVLSNLEPLEAEIRKYLKYERFVHPIRFLNLLPLSHVFGQFLGIFLPQLLGGTVIFQNTLNPSEVIQTIRRERVSVLIAVPRMLQSLKEKIERDLHDEDEGGLEAFRKRLQSAEGKHFLHRWWIFRRIRRQFGWKFWAFICGGATLDRTTEEFWHRLGYAVVQGYGLTETTAIISVNHPFRLGKGSVGKVLPGREIKLASDGEILIRGSGVASGYWKGHELNPVAAEEGWYHTGDIGEMDAEGNLYFKGRKKDVIVTPAGMNVYPEDLETALRAQPGVRDSAVIALPRNGNAEPLAVLILRDSTDPDSVVRGANASLAEYQQMHRWFVWTEEDFPRTSTHKPRSNVIREVVVAKLDSQTRGFAPASPLAELIGRITGHNPSQLAQSANLDTDLNLSSLDRVELLSALEDRYQVDLSETRFAELQTVGDVERMLRGEGAPRIHYHYPAWAQRWPVTWIRLITNYLMLLPAVFILGWPRIEGRENLRQIRGPVLVVSNHVADVDPGFIWNALPARIRHKLAIATGGEKLESYRTPPPGRNLLGRVYDRVKWILGVSLLNLFPLPREAGFRQSFAYVGESVDRGYSVLVFPEGRHTEDGNMRPFRAGIGLLARSLGIPVVPMRIDGLFGLKKAGKKFARPHSITVRIGLPMKFEAGSDPNQIARELQKKVEGL